MSDKQIGDLNLDDILRNLKTGRNAPCPCGSGQKYKKCCLDRDQKTASQLIRSRQSMEAEQADAAVTQVPSVVQNPIKLADEPKDDALDGSELGLSQDEPDPSAALWEQFDECPNPTPSQMDALLDALLQLPPEVTYWGDLVHSFARNQYPDLPGLFRKIAQSVPHTPETGMSFFYWAVVEEFCRANLSSLFPEVVANYRRLDVKCYDAEALYHIECYLLDAGHDLLTLELAEHFLPIMCQDDDLLAHALSDHCSLVLELRLGQLLREPSSAQLPVDQLSQRLIRGLEEEIHTDLIAHAVALIHGQVKPSELIPASFDLVRGDIQHDNVAWTANLRLNQALWCVAQEAWTLEQIPPGAAIVGLTQSLISVYRWNSYQKRKPKPGKHGANLLHYLHRADMEARLALHCHEFSGLILPKVRLLLHAHELLLRFAKRHQRVTPFEAEQTQIEIARLRQEVKK